MSNKNFFKNSDKISQMSFDFKNTFPGELFDGGNNSHHATFFNQYCRVYFDHRSESNVRRDFLEALKE